MSDTINKPMHKEAQAVSIVIPVFNEENHLKKSLDALKKQIEPGDEVIVVDNNSTDKSAEIARSYKFVTLIHEPKQGRGHARNAGFNRAKGDILCRLDGDSIVAPTWLAEIRKTFSNPSIDAVTGYGKTIIDPHFRSIVSVYWSWAYFKEMLGYDGLPTLWGANMAITKKMWLKVRDNTCLDDHTVHEDQDLGLLVLAKNGKIVLNKKLLIYADGERFAYIPKTIAYAVLRHRTIRHHKQQGTYALARRHRIAWYKRVGIQLLMIPPTIMYIILSIIFTIHVRILGRTTLRP